MTDKATEEARFMGRSIDKRILMAGLFAAAMIPVMVTPVLPLIDFYNHLARFYALAHVGSSALLQTYYQAHWVLLPDIGVDVIASLLLRVVPPLVGGHILTVGILAVLYSGVLYFHRAITGQRSLLVAVLLLPLLYSYILNWGFANFLLGLGLAFWGAGWWRNHRDRPLLAMPVSCLLAILIFLAHGVAFALYGVLTVAMEIGIFFDAPARQPRNLIRALFLLLAQSIVPFLLFFFWQKGLAVESALSASPVDHPDFSPAKFSMGWTIRHGHSIMRRLSTILRVEEGPAFWFDIATLLLQSAIACFLIWRRHISILRSSWILIAATLLLVVFTPQTLFGAGYIADRMPLVAAFCVLGSISLRVESRNKGYRLACGALVAIVFARLLFITIDWHAYDGRYQEYRSIAAQIPPGSLTMGIAVGAGRHETDIPRCEMYGPLLVAQFGQIGPSFSFKGQHPLLFKGRLGRAIDILESSPETAAETVSDYDTYLKVLASAGFDYLLVCNSQLLRQAFPRDMTVVARSPHFALLRTTVP